MESVFDFLSESLAPSSPVTSHPPNFLLKGQSLGDLSAISGQTSSHLYHPLTPLESKLKNIIVNIYSNNPTASLLSPGNKDNTAVNKHLSFELDEEELSTETRSPSPKPPLTIPRHLLPSSKRSVEHTYIEPSMSSNIPIFSADDIPLSVNSPPITTAIPPLVTSGVTNRPTALHSSITNPNISRYTSPYSVFSPNDLPSNTVPPSTSSSLLGAFSMPSNSERKLPGYPRRIDNVEPSTVSLNLPAHNLTDAVESIGESFDGDTASQTSLILPPADNIVDSFNKQLSVSSSASVSVPEIPEHVKATRHRVQDSDDIHERTSIVSSTLTIDNDTLLLLPPVSVMESKVNSETKPFSPRDDSKPFSPRDDSKPFSPRDDSIFQSHVPSQLRQLNVTSNESRSVKQPLPSSLKGSYYILPSEHDGKNNPIISAAAEPLLISSEPAITKPSQPLLTMPPLSKPMFPSYDDSAELLREKIHQLTKEKANLEGQLESVVKECQETLKDRAQLQSRLSKAETELTTAQDQLKSTKRLPKMAVSDQSEEGSELSVEINRLESALRKKRQEQAVMTREMKKLKKQVEDMSSELVDSKENVEKKNSELRELNSANVQLYEEVKEKSTTVEDLGNRTANLQASLDSTETAKTWLHKQLQDEIQSKLKLQEKLRELRTGSIGQTVRTDQLERENALLNRQIDELRNKVLTDKANLVNELEAIEADVLSKESSYVELETNKKQLEQMLELRNKQLERMGNETAELQAKMAEMENKTSDDSRSAELLATQLKRLEDDNKSLNNALQHERQTVENKEREMGELKKAKTSFQQRLQQAETTLIGKEGTLQGMKDSNEIMRQELEGVKMAREYAETELLNAQKSLAEMEVSLGAAETKLGQNSSELLSARNKLQNTEKKLNSMKSQLSHKEGELDKKSSELSVLEDQSSELVDQFRSLQTQFHSIADESGLGVAEKDRVINHLAGEKDQLDKELDAIKVECEQLKDSVNQLEIKNARLCGELESVTATSPRIDDIKRILQEKNVLESQLGAERIGHRQEAIRSQAKIARLQTDLSDSKKNSKKKIKELQETLDAMQREMDLNSQSEQELNKTPENIVNEASTLRELLNAKQRNLESALDQQETMKKENAELQEQLTEETGHIIEVERASTLVASQLKQSALENERRLKEEIQCLVIDAERLKGQMAGTEKAQKCLREHVNALESSLAQKEGQISKLASDNASLLSEKEIEIEDLKCAIENQEDSISGLKAELEKLLTEGLFDKQRADDLERGLNEKETELSRLKENTEDSDGKESLKQQLQGLEHQKEDLQAEVRTMKQHLALSQTSYDCTKRELQEKTELADILEKKLQLAQDQLSQSQDELIVLKEHIQLTRDQHKQEIESLKRMLPQLQTRGIDQPDNGAIFDDSTSVGSTDEVVSCLKDQNSLYKAQLQEIQGRLVKVRQEGQEAAEHKTIGEIKSLQTQLGAKSKTLRTLKDCVTSLKDEMNDMQSQMSVHSSLLANSYRSSREIESKIEGLHRSQTSGSVSSFPRASTPNNDNN